MLEIHNNDISILKDKKCLILFYFTATWCGPCRTIGPIVDELHNELDGQAVIGKVDVDSNSDTPTKYGVRNIPTLLVFKNGKVWEKELFEIFYFDLEGKITSMTQFARDF